MSRKFLSSRVIRLISPHYQLQTESHMDRYYLVPDYHHRRPFEADFSLGATSDAPGHSFQMFPGRGGDCFAD